MESNQAKRMFHKLAKKEWRVVHGPSVVHAGVQVVIVGNTLLYRHLAMTRVFEDDRAVEIGCSYGHCTALLCNGALGVDHAPEKVEEAQQKYPHCRFVTGDVFGEDLSWLDRDATALFLDIGGGKNYKPVMKALAVCIPHMPALRLVVAKSIEVRAFLLRFDNAVETVARDLVLSKDDDAEAAEELAIEIRRRGGEMPVSLIPLLRCGNRLRYLVGKNRVLGFLRGRAPLLQLVEVSSGPEADRLRVLAAPGAMPALAPSIVLPLRQEFAKKVRKQFRNGDTEYSFLGIFSGIQRSFFRQYLAVASDPELYRQGSDPSLDGRCLEPWSHDWKGVIAWRHLHAFLVSTPEFAVVGRRAGDIVTVEELRELRVICTGEASAESELTADTDAALETEGDQVVLQVLDCNWNAGEGDVPEIQDLFVEGAWLLAGGRVLKKFTETVNG